MREMYAALPDTMPEALIVIVMLAAVLSLAVWCRSDCDAVRERLAEIDGCEDFIIFDCGKCGEATQYEIDARMIALKCSEWHTEVLEAGGCTQYDVQQGQWNPEPYPGPEE